jgi:hypothetical protein
MTPMAPRATLSNDMIASGRRYASDDCRAEMASSHDVGIVMWMSGHQGLSASLWMSTMSPNSNHGEPRGAQGSPGDLPIGGSPPTCFLAWFSRALDGLAFWDGSIPFLDESSIVCTGELMRAQGGGRTAQGRPGKTMKAHESPGEPRRAQESTGEYREAYREFSWMSYIGWTVDYLRPGAPNRVPNKVPQSVTDRPRALQSVPERPNASQGVPYRSRASQSVPERSRAPQSAHQRAPECPKASQSAPERPISSQSVPERPRASQSAPERPRAS